MASLRITAGLNKDDRELTELIGELSLSSEEFAALWSRHPVANHSFGRRELRHPEVGELTLELETLALTDGSGHRVVMYSAQAGSPSHTALQLLRMRPTPTELHRGSARGNR